jgi:hypothetical protein
MEYKIKPSVFSGKPGDWNPWSKKFIARSGLMGYKSVLLGTENTPKDRSSNEFGEFIKEE